MRTGSLAVFAALLVVLLCVPRAASAQNTTFAGAQNIVPEQRPVTFTLAGTTRYYVFNAVAGRSYCAEMVATTETSVVAASGLTVYRADTSTTLAVNQDTQEEPFSGRNAAGGGFSRACWLAPATEATYLAVSHRNGATAIVWQARVVETTLFSNWFFLGGDYGAYTLLRNTTTTPVAYTITWRSGAGAAVATSTGTLAGNGSTAVNARAFTGAVTATSGTVEIAHAGSPEAITASTTVLSGTTGLSFDASFTKRQSW